MTQWLQLFARMRFAPSVLSVLLVLLRAGPAYGQPSPFRDLPLRINLGDRLTIEDQSGTRSAGRLTSLTRDDLTIASGSKAKQIPRGAIREVRVRRYAGRTSVLIGATAGVAIGAFAACTGSDRTECADGPILTGALGAGVGLALSRIFPRNDTVYRSRIDEPATTEPIGPPSPFDDLALHVNLGDRLRVEDRSGARITGRLTFLSGDEIVLDTKGGVKRFTTTAVREVAVRGHALARGALVGASIFTVAAIASPACRSNANCNPVAAAAIGAGAGLAVGSLIPRMTIVLRVSPQLTRTRTGVLVMLGW